MKLLFFAYLCLLTPLHLMAIDQNEATDLMDISKDDGLADAIPGLESVIYPVVVTNYTGSADPLVVLIDHFLLSMTCEWTSAASGVASSNSAGSGPVLMDTLNLPIGGSVKKARAPITQSIEISQL